MQTKNVGCKEDDKRIDFTSKDYPDLVGDNNKCVDQLPEENGTDGSAFQITGKPFFKYLCVRSQFIHLVDADDTTSAFTCTIAVVCHSACYDVFPFVMPLM